jgi:hypothetical protein
MSRHPSNLLYGETHVQLETEDADDRAAGDSGSAGCCSRGSSRKSFAT